MARICFFARVRQPELLDRISFYANDIRALRDSGHQVVTATRVTELRPADLYFVWWWTWAFAPLTLARMLGRPSIVTGVFDGWSYPARPAYQRALLRYSLVQANANLFLSRYELEETKAIASVHNPSCSYLGVDTTRYSPADRPRENFILSLASMSRGNSRRKSMSELVHAIPRLLEVDPGLRLVLAGEQGEDAEELAQTIAQLGVGHAVDFAGVVTEDEKIDLMRRCRVYAQPSKYEGFGMAILEAMSCGAPVVTSAVGAVPEVCGTAAEFVNGADSEDIARGIARVWESPEHARDLGNRGRARAVEDLSLSVRRVALERAVNRALSTPRS